VCDCPRNVLPSGATSVDLPLVTETRESTLLLMLATYDPRWEFYPQTILQLDSADGPLHIDLREQLPPALRERLTNLGPIESFAVLTPDNPLGDEGSASANASARIDLARELNRPGVVGGSNL
jgi:hypothetical protein